MNYINNTTQEVLNYYSLKSEFPNSSLPADGTDIIFDLWYLINPTTPPFYDTDTEKLSPGDPILVVGKYEQVWNIVPLSQQEMDDNLDNAKDIKYTEIWDYYEALVLNTQNNSDESHQTDKGYNLQKKSDKRLTKKSKGQSLSPAEEAEEDAYDGFLDWSDDNHDLADNGEDDVELMTLPSTVVAFDVANDIDWTSYTWP